VTESNRPHAATKLRAAASLSPLQMRHRFLMDKLGLQIKHEFDLPSDALKRLLNCGSMSCALAAVPFLRCFSKRSPVNHRSMLPRARIVAT
jgi:hypothetical protein